MKESRERGKKGEIAKEGGREREREAYISR